MPRFPVKVMATLDAIGRSCFDGRQCTKEVRGRAGHRDQFYINSNLFRWELDDSNYTDGAATGRIFWLTPEAERKEKSAGGFRIEGDGTTTDSLMALLSGRPIVRRQRRTRKKRGV